MNDDWADKAADLILDDLTDRGGIRQAFDSFDDSIRAEIRETIACIIRGSRPTA